MTPPPRRRSTSGPFGVGRGSAASSEVFESPGHGSHDLRATLPHRRQNTKSPDGENVRGDFFRREGVEARLGKKGGFELKARELLFVIASGSEAIQMMSIVKVETVPSYFIR